MKRSFPVSADKLLSGMDISHDEQRILLNYRFRFEIWKKVGDTYELEKSKKSDSDHYKAYFANDSKSVIATSGSFVSVYDVETLASIYESTDVGYFYGSLKLAVPSRSSNLYYVNRSFQIVKFNFLSKETKVITDFPSTSLIRSLAVSPDEKILIFASDDGALTHIKLESNQITKLVSIDNNRPIEWISFASDSKSFATVALSASIRVRRSSDGEVLTTIKDYKSPAYELWFHPSGNMIAASTAYGVMKLWHLKDLATSSDIPIDKVSWPKWVNDDQFSVVDTSDEKKWINLISAESGEQKFVNAALADASKVSGVETDSSPTLERCVSVLSESAFQLFECEKNFPIFESKYVVSKDGSVMISYKDEKLSFIRTSDFRVLAQKEFKYSWKITGEHYYMILMMIQPVVIV
ncbi:MAG: hypothetical protein EOO46_23195, partial [Flavobacterium sp.]